MQDQSNGTLTPAAVPAAKATAPAPGEREVTMFNRKAVVILVGIVAMTVMVVSFAFNAPPRAAAGAVPAAAEQVEPGAERRNYLAAPPDTGGTMRSGHGATAGMTPADVPVDAFGGAAGGNAGAYGAPDPYAAGSAYAAYPPPAEMMAPPAAAVGPPPPDPRRDSFRRALRCGVRSCPAEAAPQAAGSDSEPLAQELAQLQAGTAGAETPAPRAPGDRYSAFLRSAGADGSSTRVSSRVQRPASPYQIMAGTLIPVQLRTAINTDLPGEVVAQVTRTVYDSQQRHPLIPAGARFIGKVDNQVGLGQSRVNIAWYRLIFPNDHSLTLPGFTSADAQGAAGIQGRVNNHYGRTYVNAVLLSAISAGAQLSQPRTGGSVLTSPSAGQVAAGAVGQELGEVSTEMVRRNMQVAPTIQLPRDFQFSIYVSKDLVLTPYPQ